MDDIIRTLRWKAPGSALPFEEPVGGALEDAVNARPGDLVMVYHCTSVGPDYLLFFDIPSERVRVGSEPRPEGNGAGLHRLWLEGPYLRGFRVNEDSINKPEPVQMKDGERLSLYSKTKGGDLFVVAYGTGGIGLLMYGISLTEHRINLRPYEDTIRRVVDEIHLKGYKGVYHET